MHTPRRLENALLKLYTAYHNGSLNPECCKACAVGNILGNTDGWKHLTEAHGSTRLSYLGRLNEAFGKKYGGYSPTELLTIEAIFLKACGYSFPFKRQRGQESQQAASYLFDGLQAVVAYLCGLDHVPNVMDYTKLFETEGALPKYDFVLTE